jgi:hypothetical protein
VSSPHDQSHAVQRWQEQLAARIGMSEAEIATLRAALEVFCLRHAVSPEHVLQRWESFPELTVRRRPGAVESPNLAVESFLVHNGVNVFGNIVCVAWRPEDLAAQGAQFVGTRRADDA